MIWELGNESLSEWPHPRNIPNYGRGATVLMDSQELLLYSSRLLASRSMVIWSSGYMLLVMAVRQDLKNKRKAIITKSFFFFSYSFIRLTPTHSPDLSSIVTSSVKPFLAFLLKSHSYFLWASSTMHFLVVALFTLQFTFVCVHL